MIVDLAARLRARGLTTRLGYRGMLPLVASYGQRCVVVESDADLLAGSLRESLRLRPELLKRFGWTYVRVHAFELFQDPDLVADRIAELLGAEAAPRLAEPRIPSERTESDGAPEPALVAEEAPPVDEVVTDERLEPSTPAFVDSAQPLTEPIAIEETESGFESGPRQRGWTLGDDLDSGRV